MLQNLLRLMLRNRQGLSKLAKKSTYVPKGHTRLYQGIGVNKNNIDSLGHQARFSKSKNIRTFSNDEISPIKVRNNPNNFFSNFTEAPSNIMTSSTREAALGLAAKTSYIPRKNLGLLEYIVPTKELGKIANASKGGYISFQNGIPKKYLTNFHFNPLEAHKANLGMNIYKPGWPKLKGWYGNNMRTPNFEKMSTKQLVERTNRNLKKEQIFNEYFGGPSNNNPIDWRY